MQRPDLVDPPAVGRVREVVAVIAETYPIGLQDFQPLFVRDRGDLAEDETKNRGDKCAGEYRRDKSVEADARRFGGRNLGVARQCANGKHSRKQDRGGQHHEHRVWKPIQVAERDPRDAQLLRQILIEIVGEIDNVDENRETERGGDEDLPEFDEYVAIERAYDFRQAATLSRLIRRFFQPIFERIEPLIAPIISVMSPPRAVAPSWPIFASIQSAIDAKITFAIHIETTAGINPRLAIDSP